MQIMIRTLAAGLLAGAAGLALATGAAHAQASGTTSGATGTGGTTTGAATTPGAMTAGMMQESDVKSLLEERDFSSVEEVRQEGGAWTAKAERDGEAVEVRVERATALVGGNLDRDMVRAMLEAEGFRDVSNVEEEGDDWTAEASRDGADVRLHVIGERSVVITERKG